MDILIAAEAFYLSDTGRDELKYRLALRAALWSDSSLADWDRRQVRDHMRRAYDLRSTVAHGGDPKPGDIRVKGQQASLAEFVLATEVIVRHALHKAEHHRAWPPEAPRSRGCPSLNSGQSPLHATRTTRFRPGLRIEDARPDRYRHLVFVCGPLHGEQLAGLHARFVGLRRIAVGVSVIDPADPACAVFDLVLARTAPPPPRTATWRQPPRQRRGERCR